MVMGKCTRVVIISILTCLSQIPPVKLQQSCTNTDHCSSINGVHIWYIWLVIAIGGFLLFCGLVSICVKCCCLNCHPAGQDTRPPPYEVTVIAFDQDNSTLQSTITSLHSVFGPSARRILAVAHAPNTGHHHPAGKESPPIYEEAIQMSRFTVVRSGERAPDLEPVPEEKQMVEDGKENPQPKDP